MAIDRILRQGLERFETGEYEAAARAWNDIDEDVPLLGALASVASALAVAGKDDGAARREIELALDRLDSVSGPTDGLDVEALRADLLRPLDAIVASPPVLRSAGGMASSIARFAALVAIVGVAAALVLFTPIGEQLDRDSVVSWFEQLRSAWWAPAALIGATAIGAPLALPMTPFIIAGGVVFGPAWGALYNAIGATLGAILSFELGHHLGRDLVAKLAGERLRRVERQLARRGFWALVGIRFLPIPFPVVNFGAALAGVPRPTYVATTILGLTPAITLYTILMARMFEVTRDGATAREGLELLALMGLIALIALLPTAVNRVLRRRRYRQLMASRAERQPIDSTDRQ